MTTRTTGLGASLRTALIMIAVGAGAIVTLFTILGFFGDFWWLFDLLANYRWHYAWIALIAAIVYALAAQGIASVVFIGAVVVNAFLLAPLWLGSQPIGTGEDSVSIVSVDLYGGSSDEEATLEWLWETQADLIVAGGAAENRLLPLIVEGSPYRVLAQPDTGTSGISILGKGDYAVDAIETETTEETVYVVSVPSGAATIDVVAAWGKIASDAERAAELEERLDTIAGIVDSRSNATVVMGNLGATRFTSGMRSLLSSTALRDATEGSGYLSTWPVSSFPIIGGWIGIPVDVVLMTPDVTPLELVTGPDIGVGHLPVRVIAGATNGN